MIKPIQELAQLERVLQSLPPPKPGYLRVYRGQTTNFDKMLPSACRPNATSKGFLWKLAMMNIKETHNTQEDNNSSALDTIMNFSTWFEVLVQHYGPGSPYLDVTFSIEVALWFALNKVESTMQEYFIFMTGLQPIPIKFPTLYFSAHIAGLAWFYILDVPVWDGNLSPKHGELVNLSKGPEFVSQCSRVLRQDGALVMGDCNVDDGDLSAFYACPPIEIARPFTGAKLIDRNYQYLFPPPDEDEWYDRLLQAPLVPQPDEKNGFEYRQSLGVYIISDSPMPKEELPTFNRKTERMSLLVRASMRVNPDILKKVRTSLNVDPEEATYLQLDIPLFTALPPLNMWNQSLLHSGLGKLAQPQLLKSNNKLPAISLENVLIQLSPLETAFINHSSDNAILSALGIIRRGKVFQYTAFYTHKDHISLTSASFEIAFSNENKCFEANLKNKRIPLLQTGLPSNLLKGFFISLYILRGLSATIKPDPFFTFIIGNRGLLPIRGISTKLVRSKKDPMDMRLHFLVNSRTGEPYEGPTVDLPSIATLEVEPAEKIQSMTSLYEVYGHATNGFDQFGHEINLPQRESIGLNTEIADYLLKTFSPENII